MPEQDNPNNDPSEFDALISENTFRPKPSAEIKLDNALAERIAKGIPLSEADQQIVQVLYEIIDREWSSE